MRAQHYALAYRALVKEHPKKGEELLEEMLRVMKANGHEHLLKKVQRSLERLHIKDNRRGTIEVITSTPLSEESVQKLLKKDPFKKVLTGEHKKVVRKTDESIVGGVIIRTGNLRVDQSFKRALLDLYQNITK